MDVLTCPLPFIFFLTAYSQVSAVPVYAPINTNAYISWTIPKQSSTTGCNIFPPRSIEAMMLVYGTTGIPLGSYSTSGRVNFTGDITKGSVSFWLYEVVLSEGGIYIIKQSSPNSPSIGNQTLYVTVKPVQAVISEMAGDDAVVGSAHTLTCSATSTTMPPGLPMTYRWYANEINITAPHNEYVLEGTRNSQLRIKVVKKSDKNMAFTCSGYEVESLMSDQSAVKKIDPKYPPELYLQPDGQHNVVQNGTITMTCTVTDTNPAVSSIKWRKDGSIVANTGAVYTIASVKKTHAGRYSCEAENDIGTGTSNNTLILNVQWSPVVTLLPSFNPYYVLTTSDIILSCAWDANPAVSSYNWLFNNGHAAVVQQNYTLNNVAKANDGTYRCEARNGILQPGSGEKSVIIHYGPEITLIDRKEIIEHRKLEVPCGVDANPVASVEWTGAGIRQTSTSLVMDDIVRSQTGTYTCTAKNRVTPSGQSAHYLTKTKEVYVDVLYPPGINVIYTNATEGVKMTTIASQPNGNPKSYTFKPWKQRWLTGEEIRVFQDATQASLTLPRSGDSLGYMDSGIYTVTVSNDIPDQNNQKLQSVDVSFVVLSRPVVLDPDDLTTGTDLDVTVTISVTFYCNTGTPNVAWFRESTNESIATGTNNVTIVMSKTSVHLPVYNKTINEDGYLAKLTIENIQESHLGKYKAVISNDIGSKSVTREIVAADKPKKPMEFRTAETTASSIGLSWRPGFHGGADQTFVIQYKTDTSSWSDNFTVTGYQQQDVTFNITVKMLIPSTRYTFRIHAVNKHGTSEYAETTEITKKNEGNGDTGSPIAIIGGVVGGVAVAVAVIVIIAILVLWRRRSAQKVKGNTAVNGREMLRNEDDDGEMTENDLYNRGPVAAASVSHTAAAGGGDVYAEVNKETKSPAVTRQETPIDANAEYTQVKKVKKPDNKQTKEEATKSRENVMDNKEGKKEKKKAPEKKKGKPPVPSKQTGPVYENPGLLTKGSELSNELTYENASSVTAAKQKESAENIYENNELPKTKDPERYQNPDGLIYLSLNIQGDKKDEKTEESGGKDLIIGADDMTPYTTIDWTKRADPLPDNESDEG